MRTMHTVLDSIMADADRRSRETQRIVYWAVSLKRGRHWFTQHFYADDSRFPNRADLLSREQAKSLAGTTGRISKLTITREYIQ